MNLPLSNFLSWYAQIGLAVVAGAALPYAFRLKAPKALLVFWHVLLLACVALPLVQPWRTMPMATLSEVTVTTGPVQIKDGAAGRGHVWTGVEIAAAVLLGGSLLRLAWLGIGILRLGRYRRAAEQLLPLPDEARRVVGRLGVYAALYLSEDVTSPVTFGVRNPAILLPAGFLELPPEKREPVFCHELLHVQRNDWLFAIGEEIVRAVLWFHPAVWWLLSRIQLAREQVVDHAVIEYTQAPDVYVDALLAIAATRLEADLAPAPLFLKKRHLRQRVASIVKGVSMSKRNLLLSSIAVFSSLPLVMGIVAWQFPLNAAPQEVRDSAGVEVKGGYYKLLHRTAVAYPADAREKGISGAVVVSVSLNSNGEVADAKVVSGPEELRKAALNSVLTWHFSTEPWDVNGVRTPVPPSFEVAIQFSAAQAAPVSRPGTASTPAARAAIPVDRVDLSQIPAALRDQVSQKVDLPRQGQMLTLEDVQRLAGDLRKIDQHLSLTANRPVDGKVVLRAQLIEEETIPKSVVQAAGPGQIRVGGNAQATRLVSMVTPLYPPEAKAERVQGVVRMNATIDREGRVSNLELISGHPLLADSAMAAVKQWVYTPTLLNGNPVEVLTQIDVNYTLSQ